MPTLRGSNEVLYGSMSVSSCHGVSDLESKTLGLQVRWICKECLIDRGQSEVETMLYQQHLSGPRADEDVFREPRKAEKKKKVSAIRVRLKPRQRDMKQRMIGEED